MAGFTAERYAYYNTQATRDNVPNNMDIMQEVNAGDPTTAEAYGSTSYNTLVSFLGRVMYNYDNRYYISASLRADGSSRFPKGNKYALFPAVSASWRITSEEFMKDQEKITSVSPCPECFGKRKIGRRCPDCVYDESCRIYGIMEKTEKSGIRHLALSTAPLQEGFDAAADESRIFDDEDEQIKFRTKDGKKIEISGINLKIAVYCLILGAEKPKSAKAVALKLSGCKNLSDVAEYLGVTRQAIHSGIQNELGIKKRVLKDSAFKKLSPDEFRFYKLKYEDGCTIRSIALQTGIPKSNVERILQRIRAKLRLNPESENGTKIGSTSEYKGGPTGVGLGAHSFPKLYRQENGSGYRK